MELLIISLPILIFSVILHEIAHGFVADRLGDPTARIAGRLTLDPRPHIDPMMSVLLPTLLILSGSPIIFGAAKPVPVDPFNLREGRKDLALVALAGPLTNLLLAIAAAMIYRILIILPQQFPAEVGLLFILIARINLLLAIFNLIPIPPLDGSKFFSMLLPEKQAASYLSIGAFGTFILFFLLLFPIGPFDLGNLIYQLMETGMMALGF